MLLFSTIFVGYVFVRKRILSCILLALNYSRISLLTLRNMDEHHVFMATASTYPLTLFLCPLTLFLYPLTLFLYLLTLFFLLTLFLEFFEQLLAMVNEKIFEGQVDRRLQGGPGFPYLCPGIVSYMFTLSSEAAINAIPTASDIPLNLSTTEKFSKISVVDRFQKKFY